MHRRSVEELVPLLEADGQPRVAWSMVPAGHITDSVISELAQRLGPGDVVVDGGNSNYLHSIRHGEGSPSGASASSTAAPPGAMAGPRRLHALMVGGAPESVAVVQPLFDALAPERGFAHVGPVGSGHYVKMVHNGVEYGLMQAYAEGYAILEASPLIDVEAAIGSWQEESVVRSWLLELLIKALEETPDLDGMSRRSPRTRARAGGR
ncbi:MAG: NAD(P)-binding domain-containing protein [Acidimicrobiales bacterium]